MWYSREAVAECYDNIAGGDGKRSNEKHEKQKEPKS